MSDGRSDELAPARASNNDGASDEATERFGSGGRTTLMLGYGALLVVVVIALWGLLNLGNGLDAPSAQGEADERSTASAEDILWRLLLAGIVILIAARLVGSFVQKFHQPRVVGEIIAGILLGPSLVGKLWPAGFEFLFPVDLMPYLDVVANLGLIFYMFLVGLELDFDLMRGRGHAALLVSHASIVAPFLLGVALALWLYPTLGSEAKFSAFGLFIGAAMAITAFPVLARILTDRGLYKTQLGTVALTVGAVDDITAWSMLAVIIALARATALGGAMLTVGAALLFTLFTIFFVRPIVLRVSEYYERRGKISGSFLAVVFLCILTWAFVTERLGIHVIFGAFLFGAIMPHSAKFVRELTEKLEDFSVVLLLPFFFTFSGIRTNVFAIGLSPQLWLMTLSILVVAILGKWGGSKLAARSAGLSWREAGALGVLVNCRGLTELIILNIGLQLGVLPSTVFAMMVIMAVVTTLMTEPALALYYPRDVQRRMIDEQQGRSPEEDGARPWKVLVTVGHNTATAGELVHTATLLAGAAEREAEILLLSVVEVSGTEVSHAPVVQDQLIEDAVHRLRPLVQTIEEAGCKAVPLAVPAGDIGGTIVRTADERDVDLVLLGYHEAIFGERLFGGIVGQVLTGAAADTAVLIDPGVTRQLALRDRSKILVPYGGGFHEDAGVDLAMRLGRATGAQVTLLGPGSVDGDQEQLDKRATDASEQGKDEDSHRRDVPTDGVVVDGDITDELVARAGEVDLLVLGVNDRFSQEDILQTVRDEAMHRAGKPYLVVRRQNGRHSRIGRLKSSLKHGPRQVLAVLRAGHASDVEAAEIQTKERLEGQKKRDEAAPAGRSHG